MSGDAIPKGATVLINRGPYLGRKGEVVGMHKAHKDALLYDVYLGCADVVSCCKKRTGGARVCKSMTIKSILFMACLLVSLSVVPGTCSAAQTDTVTIQMQDYLILKQNFLTLQLNNEKQAMLLAQLKEQLAVSQTQQDLSVQDWQKLKQQLTEAQEKTQQLQSQCEVLQQQLTSALQASKTAESGLQSAQQSLTELSKAIKAERKAAERRETILKIIAGGALVYGLTK